MRFAKFFSRHHRSSGSSPAAVLAVARAVIETLEVRRLLSTITIPLSAHSVDLTPGDGGQGDILVYADTQVDPVGEFHDPHGTDIIDCNGASVTCVDHVPAAIKPQVSGGGSIQFINGGAGSTLQLNAGFSDRLIQVTGSTSSGTTVKTTDTTDTTGNTAGTDGYDSTFSHLTLHTNEDDTPTDFPQGTRVYAPVLYGSGALTVDTGAGTYDTIELGGGGTSATDPSTVTDAHVITGAGHDRVLVSSRTDAADLGLDQPSATVDFGVGTGHEADHGLDLGNELRFGCGGQATIANLTGHTDPVVVDFVESQFAVGFYGPSLSTLQPPATVTVADTCTIGDLWVYGLDSATLAGANTYVNTLKLQGTVEVTAPVTIDTITLNGTEITSDGPQLVTFAAGSGSSTVGAVEAADTVPSPSPAINVNVEAGASVTFGTGTLAGPLSFYSLTTAGTVDLSRAVTIATLNLTGGRVTLDQAGTWQTNPMANTITTLNLTGGVLDLDGQDVVTTTDVSLVRSFIAGMYDGGAWDGTSGITSSYAPNASTTTYAIGYATSSDNATTGLSLSGTQVLIRPTVAGDATQDGVDDTADFTAWRNHYDPYSGDRWAQGDFDYNGVVDYNDFTIWYNCFFGHF